MMKRILGFLDKTIDFFIVLMLVGIVVTITLQVAFRYIFQISAPWTEEVARFMFIYLTYIGAALAIREKSHIAIDILVERLPRMLRAAVHIIVQLAIIFFLSILLKGSWIMVESSTDVSSATMRWLSMSYVYLALFLGSVLMIFYSVLRVIEVIKETFFTSNNSLNDSSSSTVSKS
ncbi:TRAP-type C4-dicarboxylate transport system permease small subunit [Caldalkalibacillus uzonensis]|uniref:TRAP-type C4-dicarboxylate transport system permease small subunit n=1 Tax=Caldalkalibacillus uzonensis TaxID=353224 RepID=A0ABU0CPE9_9BACI|nr:TRAP transporter small permease [Caldalkalibacillus uzonensis]MDQ0338287.1 TRAP-type C4-dicarboxylate transport system permease small subunit [Caldalkalibacillus uzonensis]